MDLQGGSYLLLEVESNVLIAEELENINDVVLQLARKEKTRILKIETKEDEIFFNFLDSSSLKNIQTQLSSQYRDLIISENEYLLKIKVSENFKKRIEESAIKQS